MENEEHDKIGRRSRSSWALDPTVQGLKHSMDQRAEKRLPKAMEIVIYAGVVLKSYQETGKLAYGNGSVA